MSAVLVGERYRQLLASPLAQNGFEPVFLPDSTKLDSLLAGHADLSVCLMPRKKAVLSRELGNNNAIVNFLTNRGMAIYVAENDLAPDYPADVPLCAAFVGGRLLHRLNCTDKAVTENFDGEKINTKQGYTKCSVLTFDNAAVSSDTSILKAIETFAPETDCLRLDWGDILLEGFDAGFIGGASFNYDNIIYLTGRLGETNTARLNAFAEKHRYKVKYLTDSQAFDVGGILPV